MQEAKYTPGPWQIIGDDEYTDGCPCIDIGNSDNTTSIAYVVADVDEGVVEEDRANARLIAAAPELLEALSLLLEAVEMDIALFPDQPHKDSRIGKARAAIAKATASEGAI